MTPGAPRRIALALFLSGCYHPSPSPPLPDAWKAPAAPDPAAPRPDTALGCDALLSAVLARDPTLRAARAGVPVARAERDAAGRWEGPELRISDDLRALSEEPRVGLRLQVPAPGAPGAEEAAAEARERLTAAEIRLLEVEVARTVRLAFAELARASAEVALAEEEARAAVTHTSLMAERERVGTATAVAAEEARLASREATRAAEKARRRAARLSEETSRRAGVHPELAAACAGPAGAAPGDDHPAQIAASAFALAADADAFAASRAEWIWPTFIQIGWARDVTGRRQEDRIVAEVGIALPLPGPDPGDVAAAEADRARIAATAVAEETTGAVREAEARWQLAREERAALEADRAAIEAARALLSRGEGAGASPSDLGALAKRVRAYRQHCIDADYEVARAAAEVWAARGEVAARDPR